MAVAAYTLFLLAGLGFGYAAPGRLRWLPLLFPLALALGAFVEDGIDGAIFVRLIVALLVTAGGVLLGTVLDRRTGRTDRARYA